MMPIKDAPCDVCGKENNNAMEPRFGYVVCEEHINVTPVVVSRIISERKNTQ